MEGLLYDIVKDSLTEFTALLRIYSGVLERMYKDGSIILPTVCIGLDEAGLDRYAFESEILEELVEHGQANVAEEMSADGCIRRRYTFTGDGREFAAELLDADRPAIKI